MGDYEDEYNTIKEFNEKAKLSLETHFDRNIKPQYSNSVTSSPITKKKLKFPKNRACDIKLRDKRLFNLNGYMIIKKNKK